MNLPLIVLIHQLERVGDALSGVAVVEKIGDGFRAEGARTGRRVRHSSIHRARSDLSL